MYLTKEEADLIPAFKQKWYSKEQFNNYILQKRQEDFLKSTEFQVKTPNQNVVQKNTKQATQDTNNPYWWTRQGFDLWWDIWEWISNIWKKMKFESKKDDWIFTSAWKFIWNIPWNLLQIWWWVVSMVSNPIWTFEGGKEALWWAIENWLNSIFSTDIWQSAMRWLWNMLWANPETVENNLAKMRWEWFYTNQTREQIWKWIDKFWNELKEDPFWTMKKIAVEHPADLLLLWSWATAAAWRNLSKVANTAKVWWNLEKAEKFEKISNLANKTSEILNPINVTKNIYGKPIVWLTNIAWSTLKTVTSKLSWLNPTTLTEIVKNPEIFRKVKKWDLTFEKLAKDTIKSIDERIKEVWELWQKYETVKKWDWKINTNGVIPRKILEKYDIKVTEKWLDFSSSEIWTIADENAIERAFNLIKTRKLETWKDIINLRRALDSNINYEWASNEAQNIIRAFRKNIDEVAKEQVPWLNILDKRYWPEVAELNKVKKYLFNRNWELKDDYISRISNLAWKWKEKTLERIKRIVPEIEHEINALKAFSDVELAKWNKVWAYMQSLAWWFWAVTWWLPWLVAWALITNPSLVSNLLQHYWASQKYISNITNKVKNWIKLNPTESSKISELLKNQIIADKVDKFAEKFWWKSNFMPWDTKSNSTYWSTKINNIWDNNINKTLTKESEEKWKLKDINNKYSSVIIKDEIPNDAMIKLTKGVWKSKDTSLFIKIVSDKTQQLANSNWLTIKWHTISSRWIKHILDWHWVNANLKPWEIPVTVKDIKKIPGIIKDPDNVRISPYKSKNKETVIIYEKTIWNKYYYLEYLDNNWILKTKTMYINKI